MGMQNDMNLENDKAGFLIHTFILKIRPLRIFPRFYREAIRVQRFMPMCYVKNGECPPHKCILC